MSSDSVRKSRIQLFLSPSLIQMASFTFFLLLVTISTSVLCLKPKILNHVHNLEEFQQLIRSSPNLLIDFYSDSCGPCRVLSRVLSEVATAHPEVTFVKINVDEHPRLADEFNVSVLPTVFYLRNGQWTEKFMGAVSKPEVVKFIKRNYVKPQESEAGAQPMQPILEELPQQEVYNPNVSAHPSMPSKKYRKQRKHFY